MTERIDFYVLNTQVARDRWLFVCRLTEKAYLRDLKVVLLSESAAELQAVDDLLWTFSERSFVPHDVAPHDGAAPVQLTPDLDAVESADLLVNLGASLPTGLQRFNRIAEIVDADEERRRLGRERFKAYRELKLPVETHRLDDAAGA